MSNKFVIKQPCYFFVVWLHKEKNMRELTSETRIKIAMEIEVTSVSVKSPHWGNNNCMFINGPSRLDPVNVVCQKGRKGGLSSRVKGWGRGW